MSAARTPRAATAVRARLALWHAAFLGVLVLALAAAGVWYVDRALRGQVDEELGEVARVVASALAARGGGAGNAGAVLSEMQSGRLDVLLADRAARQVVAGRPAPRHGTGVAGVGAADSNAWRGLLAAALAAGGGPTIGADVGAATDTAPFTVRDPALGERRVVVLPVTVGAERPQLLVVARDLGDVAALVAALRQAAALALLGALPVALMFGWLLARRSLAPVLAMSAHAARIGAAGPGGAPLSERLRPRTPGDELGQLAAVFNALLDRLAEVLAQQRQFMADASHELRTPAAVVRSAADVALRRDDRTSAEYREALEIAGDEAERMTRLVDDLFLLARADAGQPTLRAADFYLDETLAECARALRPVAAARGVALVESPTVDAAVTDGAACRGDEVLVRRLVLNLLENAVRFTPPGGTVTLRLAPDELARDPAARARDASGPADVRPAWRVEVEDTGPGVPLAFRERVFDRFFHSEAHAPAAPRGAGGRGGAGLGLAMARAIAESHGGRLVLARSDAGGSLFVAVLPHEADEADAAFTAR